MEASGNPGLIQQDIGIHASCLQSLRSCPTASHSKMTSNEVIRINHQYNLREMNSHVNANHSSENLRLQVSLYCTRLSLNSPSLANTNRDASTAIRPEQRFAPCSSRTFGEDYSNYCGTPETVLSRSGRDGAVETKRLSLLNSIRTEILKDKEYYLAEKTGRAKAPTDDLMMEGIVGQGQDPWVEGINWNSMTDDQIWQTISESKAVSQAIQQHVLSVEQIPGRLVSFCRKHLASLLIDSFGNYLLQRMVVRCQELLAHVANYCQDQFWTLLENEFASRVMQTVVSYSEYFRGFVFECFHHKPFCFFKSVSGVFLVLVAIKTARDDREYLTAIERLFVAPYKPVACKYACRVLVAAIEVCNEHTLDLIVQRAGISSNILKFLTEKFASYMLIGVLIRNHQPTIEALVKVLKSGFREVFESRCWKIFTVRILKKIDTPFIRRVYLAIKEVDPREVSPRRDLKLLYWLILLQCSVLDTPFEAIKIQNKAAKDMTSILASV